MDKEQRIDMLRKVKANLEKRDAHRFDIGAGYD